MNIAEHITALDGAGQRLAAAAEAAGPDAAVPSCPDWVVRDLVRHLGGVHRWATGYVAGQRTELWEVDLDDVVGEWPSDGDLIDWFGEGLNTLVQTLTDADPDLVCFAWLPAPSPLAMWSRRQAHETTVHRVDAELAAGWLPSALPVPFAADGVDEMLRCFITRHRGVLRADPVRRLRVRCTDDPGDWLIMIGNEQVVTRLAMPGGDEYWDHVDCRVTGTANDLYLALWNRKPTTTLSVEGDASVLRLLTDNVKIRWT
ncbi:MAG TPA: maleylpyruvate isomerase family mycothiol-dependent enzyme [Streptosporangiaceae bacterium]|jgi:uncharacterized protein (TIGR03083 family)|nr:maleylpyruvate isomerase family mycothiol-dependent enzyme [Streptosporangiaceae bacterium]